MAAGECGSCTVGGGGPAPANGVQVGSSLPTRWEVRTWGGWGTTSTSCWLSSCSDHSKANSRPEPSSIPPHSPPPKSTGTCESLAQGLGPAMPSCLR